MKIKIKVDNKNKTTKVNFNEKYSLDDVITNVGAALCLMLKELDEEERRGVCLLPKQQVLVRKEGANVAMNSLVIYGRPTTKKNSSRVVYAGKYPKVLPSKAYSDYENLALQQLQFYRKRFYVGGPVHVRCRYYMPDKRSWPDLVGLLQATSDVLTKAKIIDDDKWIVHYDGSRIVGVDKAEPRAEIEIIPIEAGTPLHELKRKDK